MILRVHHLVDCDIEEAVDFLRTRQAGSAAAKLYDEYEDAYDLVPNNFPVWVRVETAGFDESSRL